MKIVSKYFYSLIYALSTSLSFVFIAKIEEKLPPLLCLVVSLLIAVIFFHLMNGTHLAQIYKKTLKIPLLWFAISITIAIIWITGFFGADEVGGFVFLFVYFISSAVISYLVLTAQKEKFSYYHAASTAGLIILLIVFIIQNTESYLGISLAIIGGISSYFYRKLSYLIANKSELTATQRLTVSYYLIILPGPFLISRGDYELLNLVMIAALFGIATISFIIPLYSNQKGIENAGAEHHSIISAICPLLTCLLEFSINGTFLLSNLIYSIIGSFFLILGKIPR